MLDQVLLIDVESDIEQKEISSRLAKSGQPPLGLLYLVAYAQDKFPDVNFRIFHTATSQDPEKEIEFVLREFKPQLVGIRSLSLARSSFQEIAGIVRSVLPDVPLIAGGPYPSSSYQDLVSTKEVDLVVRDEGEVPFARIIGRMRETGKLPGDVPGTVLLESGKVKLNPTEKPIQDLDTIPFPAYQAINLGDYGHLCDQTLYLSASQSALIYASRGCPYQCFYCHDLMGKKLRRRSAENVVEEMRHHVEKNNIRNFCFVDDIFNVPAQKAKECLTLIAKELPGIRINFPNGLRGDQMDEEIIDLLEAAGAVYMGIAVETASQRLQKVVGKFSNVEKVRKNIELASKRFLVRATYMIGFPTETYEEAMSTIRFAEETQDVTEPVFNIVRVFEGTDLFHALEPTEKQKQQLIAQEQVSFGPKLFMTENFFYGDLFSRDKVPLTGADIQDLRLQVVRRVLSNPHRIKHTYALTQKHLTHHETLEFYKSLYDNPDFDDIRLQQMLDRADVRSERNVKDKTSHESVSQAAVSQDRILCP
jgi:radical SAM superfamily enzyme YgiQ (UPF0313 family)